MWRALEDAAQTAVDTEPAIKMSAKRRSSWRRWEVSPAVLARPAKTRRDDRIVEHRWVLGVCVCACVGMPVLSVCICARVRGWVGSTRGWAPDAIEKRG